MAIVRVRCGGTGGAAVRRRTAFSLARLTEWLPALADRVNAWALPAIGTSCLVGPGRSIITTVRVEEKVEGERIRTAHVLAFHDPKDGRRRTTVQLPGRCAGAGPVPGTEWVATVADDGAVSVWDPSGAERLAVATAVVGDVTAVALPRRGDRVAIADSAGRVHLVDLRAEGAPRPLDPRAQPAVACAVDPQGRWAATATPGRAVLVWDLDTGDLRHVFPGHPGKTWADQFTPVRIVAPGGGWLAYGDGGGRVRVRDPQSGERLAVVPGEGGELATAAHPTWFATAERDGRVRLWSPDGALLRVLDGHGGPVSATAASPDGALLVTACVAAVRLWDTARGRPGPSTEIDQEGLGGTRRLVLGAAGRLALAGDGPELRLYDAADGRRSRTWTARSPITALAADPEMAVLVTGHVDGTATAWCPLAGTSTVLGSWHASAVAACAVNTSGALAAIVDADGELQVCDLRTSNVVATAGAGDAIADCRWTPDGRVLVTGRGGVHLFAVATSPVE